MQNKRPLKWWAESALSVPPYYLVRNWEKRGTGVAGFHLQMEARVLFFHISVY